MTGETMVQKYLGARFGDCTVAGIMKLENHFADCMVMLECVCGSRWETKGSWLHANRLRMYMLRCPDCRSKLMVQRASEEYKGRKYGMLTIQCATERLKNFGDFRNALSYYSFRCRCECGNELTVNGVDLTSGTINNCGCKYDGNAVSKEDLKYFYDSNPDKFGSQWSEGKYGYTAMVDMVVGMLGRDFDPKEISSRTKSPESFINAVNDCYHRRIASIRAEVERVKKEVAR